MERKLRKRQDSLYICAWGVLILSVWSIIKTILYFTLAGDQFFQIMFDGTEVTKGVEVFIMVFVFILIAIDLAFRFHVFRKAAADARSKKKVSPVYIVLAFFFVALSIISIPSYFTTDHLAISWTDSMVSMLVELTSLATTAELIYSAITVRRLRKKIAEQEI